MIVSYAITDPDTWWRPLGEWQFASHMKKLGVTWQQASVTAGGIQCGVSDVVLVDNRLLDSWSWDQPTIIFEKIDQCNIGIRSRNYLQHPMCLGIIKPGCYENLASHNGYMIGNSRLSYLLGTTLQPKKPEPIRQEDLDRVMLINTNNWAQTWGCNWYFQDPPEEKPIDIAVSMMLDSSLEYYRSHRQFLLRQMCRLASDFRVAIVACHNKPVDHRSSFEVLRQAKIAVCPFGVTEHCFRDWEAILAGCVTIKPVSEPLAVMDDPWLHAFSCKPFFEDLRCKLTEVLPHIDSLRQQVEKQRRGLVQRISNLQYLAVKVKEGIEGLLERKNG